MSRSWLAFGVGLLVLASPLRRVWTTSDRPWTPFVVAAGLVALGAWVSRAPR